MQSFHNCCNFMQESYGSCLERQPFTQTDCSLTPALSKMKFRGRKNKSFVFATVRVRCAYLNYPPLKTEKIWLIPSIKINESSTSLFFLQPFTAPHRSYYWGSVTATALTSPSIPPSSSATPNGTGLLSLSQLMQFFILCNFLPLIWKTNTSLLSKNILKHCQQSSTQSKTTITTQCECTIEATFLVRQIFKFLGTARKIIQVTKRKGCSIIAKTTLLCHHET